MPISHPRNYRAILLQGARAQRFYVLALFCSCVGLLWTGVLRERATGTHTGWIGQGQMSEVPLSAWARGFPMTKAVHRFQSVSRSDPSDLTFVDLLTDHVKSTDTIDATVDRVTTVCAPRLTTVAGDQSRAPHLTSGFLTLIHVRVHCHPHHPSVGASSEGHDGWFRCRYISAVGSLVQNWNAISSPLRCDSGCEKQSERRISRSTPSERHCPVPAQGILQFSAESFNYRALGHCVVGTVYVPAITAGCCPSFSYLEQMHPETAPWPPSAMVL